MKHWRCVVRASSPEGKMSRVVIYYVDAETDVGARTLAARRFHTDKEIARIYMEIDEVEVALVREERWKGVL